MQKLYTIKKQRGKFWVIAPSGKAIVIPHKSRREAQRIADVFNFTRRLESTVKTKDSKLVDTKPVLIEVSGGVVTNVWHAKEWHVIDWDTLLGDGADTKAAWEKLPECVQEEIEQEYCEDFDKIQELISLSK